ncbi:glycoside hydrolase family 19 protein [Pseudaeromonas pectinilytica]
MADPVLTVPASVGTFPGARAAASSLPSIPHGERPFGAPNPATPVAAAQSARPVPAPRAQARVQTDGDTGVEAGPATTRLSFPVCRADGQPFADLAEIEALLSAEQQGQFILGSNRSWHGGIHITAATMPQHRAQQPLRCMMDGTVIAYRLNRNYPTVDWHGKPLAFSNGFCLIRHDYCSPPAEAAPPASSAASGATDGRAPHANPAAARNQLRLYSLYMHLADYQHYQPVVTQERILTLLRTIYVRRGNDIQQRLGKLTAGSTIRLLDTPSSSLQINEQGRLRTLRFLKGLVTHKAAGSQALVALQAEVWVADCEEYVRHSQQPSATGGATPPAYWNCRVKARLLNTYPIYRTQEDLLAERAPEGRLQVGSTLQFQRHDLQSRMVGGVRKQLVPCELLSGVSGSSLAPVTGSIWVVVDDHLLALEPGPPSVFEVVVHCEVPIVAGDGVGFLGLQQTPVAPLALGTYRDDYRAHIELFSDEEAGAIERLLQNAAGVEAGQSLLYLQGAEALFDRVQQGDSLHFSDRCQCPDPDQLLPIQAQIPDAEGQIWCELKGVRSGFAALSQVYVRAQDVQPIRQLDLARQGFCLIQTKAASREIVLAGEQIPAPFRAIYQQLDLDQNGELSADEIAAALQHPDHRVKLHKLIVQHPSEWGAEHQQQVSGYLQQLMAQSPEQEARDLLALELERLKALGIATIASPVYLFHPLQLLTRLAVVTQQAALVVLEMLLLLCPVLRSRDCTPLLGYLNLYMPQYQIDTPLRICHFLSQVAHESAFQPKAENLNYRPARMREVYGCIGGSENYQPAIDDCRRGRKPQRVGLWDQEERYAHHPEALANLVYAERMDNGNEASGDGFKFRGRGLLQLTGRDNYTLFTGKHNELFPNDPQDFVQHPDLLIQNLKYAVESACFYWQLKRINSFADQDDFPGVTRRVNGGENGARDREMKIQAIKLYYSRRGML